MRGATKLLDISIEALKLISILAPRAGRDQKHHQNHEDDPISILAPRAGRDDIDKKLRDLCDISILAPRAGRDAKRSKTKGGCIDFNPRAPHGARRSAAPSIKP